MVESHWQGEFPVCGEVGEVASVVEAQVGVVPFSTKGKNCAMNVMQTEGTENLERHKAESYVVDKTECSSVT